MSTEEKRELLGWNSKQIEEVLYQEMLHAMCGIDETEIHTAVEAFFHAVQLELESAQVESVTTRASVKSFHGDIVVVKAKKLNLTEMLGQILSLYEIIDADSVSIKLIILLVFFLNGFVHKLDADSALIYEFLFRQYYFCNTVYATETIKPAIREYLKEYWEDEWTNRKINDILEVLENDVKVIELVDGRYIVVDQIYLD
ncbi:MAG: hypothetical protein IJ716_09660 [Lachnospiraceae bacterium]|nr:hypothetical protein [Lachnospiraceae bacterium]